MADFAYVGKKGTGKSKHAVMTMRDYLSEGRRVATNIDIDLSVLFGKFSRHTYIRVPDKPSAFDLQSIGRGYDGDDYRRRGAGALVLDELGIWFNTRDFTDKRRAESLAYLALCRKYRWDVYYLMQDVEQVDKQLRVSFIQYTCRHTALEDVRIPFVGWIISLLFGKRAGYLPEFYVWTTRQGTNPLGVKTDGGSFLGRDIERAYDTEQIFGDDYPHGAHSVLSPWHVEGRYLKPEFSFWQRLRGVPRTRPSPRPPLPAVAAIRGLLSAGAITPDRAASLTRRYLAYAGAGVAGSGPAHAGPGPAKPA
jgi:hypothetical protein